MRRNKERETRIGMESNGATVASPDPLYLSMDWLSVSNASSSSS